MGFGHIKKSVEVAIDEALRSREFKNSVNKVVSTSINEAAEIIEKIVDKKVDQRVTDEKEFEENAKRKKEWTKIPPSLIKGEADDKPKI